MKHKMIPIASHHKALFERALPVLLAQECGPSTSPALRDLLRDIYLAIGTDPESPTVKLLQEPACYSK